MGRTGPGHAPAPPRERGRVLHPHARLRRHPRRAFNSRAPTRTARKPRWSGVPDISSAPCATDPSPADADKVLRDAIKGGAVSIGELKFHVALDSPEMRRVYDIAAELQVPVMMHIQTFPHFEGELPYNTDYPQFDKVLRAYPRTNFIGHGDLFWAHISADVPTDRGYPAGPIKTGGLTDRWLSDFPNLYADMSANSGNNALSRDTEFSPGFITRHKSKLIFGSDCSCTDGNGAGISQGNNPEASRLAGKCVARETLGVSKAARIARDLPRDYVWQRS